MPELRQDGDEIDVDKAWQAIHFLLTGNAEALNHPLGFLMSGGTLVGNEDVGYGPARADKSQELSIIVEAIKVFDRETLYSRYKPRKMDQQEIYPQIWVRDGEEGFNYVYENFQKLITFLKDTQVQEQGFLVFLTLQLVH